MKECYILRMLWLQEIIEMTSTTQFLDILPKVSACRTSVWLWMGGLQAGNPLGCCFILSLCCLTSPAEMHTVQGGY